MKLFIEFSRGSANSQDFIRCLCKKYKNISSYNLVAVEEHLYVNGIDPKYSPWVIHSEPFPQGIRFGAQAKQMRDA